jgi:DNA-binding transcriptional MerR regulator
MTTENKDLVQIGDLAKQLGITTRTIRYYEEIGLMGLSQRVGTGARLYGRDDIRRLKFILKLKELGIGLKEMRELADNFDAQNQSYNSQEHQFNTITQRLLEILDLNIHKVDEKISTLSSLRKDIVDYRMRILDDLKEKES